MASWVCRADGTVFPVGSAQCPSQDCGARDAYEQGGPEDVNVYDAVEQTGIRDPNDALDAVSARVAEAMHDARRESHGTPVFEDARASVLQSGGEGEAAARLGDSEGVTYRDPAHAAEQPVDLPVDKIGETLPDAVEGDSKERVDDRGALGLPDDAKPDPEVDGSRTDAGSTEDTPDDTSGDKPKRRRRDVPS